MKVEFLVNENIGDGRQIFIPESEFKKAKDDEDEFNSFAFATNCLFAFYGNDKDFVRRDEYEAALAAVEKGGAVIITIEEDRNRRLYPEIYVSNKNRLKKVEI